MDTEQDCQKWHGGSSYVLTRVPLCQNQTPLPSGLSPTQTTLMPGGGFQAVAWVRLFQ